MFERLFEQLPDLILLFFVSVICGLMESIIMPEKRGIRHWLALFIVSAPIGVLAGGIAMELHAPDFVTLAITGCSAILARDGLHAMILNKGAVFQMLKRGLDQLIDKFTK